MMTKFETDSLIDELWNQFSGLGEQDGRYLVAVAGPPGSGKSTLAEQLVMGLNDRAGDNLVGIVPMDGFHLSNEALDQLGERHRKGAIHTFDAHGFVALVEQLGARGTPFIIFENGQTQPGYVPAKQMAKVLDQTLPR